MIRFRVIGSGTVAPAADRVAPAHWVEAGPVSLLLDCGAGALHRMAALGVAWDQVTHVALTHFHTDHWGELPHLLLALRWGIEPARDAPLTLIGPVGLAGRLAHLGGALGDWVQAPGYPLEVIEIPLERPLALDDAVELEAFPTPHTEESVAYGIRHGGVRVVYTGDTGPSAALAAWALRCDLLVAECSLPADRALDVHLTPAQAGALAREARARKLVLTHFYPPVASAHPETTATDMFGGPVVAARDGDTFTIEA